MRLKRGLASVASGLAILAASVSTASAQLAPPPPPVVIPQPEILTDIRARYENMTEADVRAAGFAVEPACVSSVGAQLPPELGDMGYHALHERLWAQQFRSGELDPSNPPILLLNADKRVVGVEWESKATNPQPALFDQNAPLLPGHPGPEEVNVPHYALHIYFRPNDAVLVSVWDPQVRCAPAAQTGPSSPPTPAPAAPAPASNPRPAPVQVPR